MPSFREAAQMFGTFAITVLAWIFFRAESLGHAINYVSGIASRSLFSIPRFGGGRDALVTMLLVVGFLVIEWLGREQEHAIARLGSVRSRVLRYGSYYAMIITIFAFGVTEQQFIYFQF